MATGPRGPAAANTQTVPVEAARAGTVAAKALSPRDAPDDEGSDAVVAADADVSVPAKAADTSLPAAASALVVEGRKQPVAQAEAPPAEAAARLEIAPATSAVRPRAAAVAAPSGADVPRVAHERTAPLVLQDAAPVGWHLAREAGAPAAESHTAPVHAAPAAPQPVVGQVAVAIARANAHRVEIRLDPPELGRVQIHLTPVDGGIQAVVLSDRPETQDLLRRHAGALAQELGDAGFGNVSLDFADGRQAPPEAGDRRPPPNFEAVPGGAPAAGLPVSNLRPAAVTGGLDIRL